MTVLLAVVEAGSISAGSRKLNAPLPSVSRKVAELERHLGTRLLIRTSRNVQLTDAGRDYVAAARQIIAQLEDAERQASGEYQAPRGALTITMPVEFGRRYVMPIALDFLEAHGDISLNILSVDRPMQLMDEHVDIGVRLGKLADSSLYAVRVGEFRTVTCASPAYLKRHGTPASPEELEQHDGVVFDALANVWWDYATSSKGHSNGPRPRLRVNTAGAAVNAALRGVGVTRLLDFMVADELRSGTLVRLFPDDSSSAIPVHMIYPNQGLLPVKVRAFLDWTVPRLRTELLKLSDLR
jgi:DNA-binding transcriptional LysR family regulator